MANSETYNSLGLRKTACVACRARKVRCDKIEPCNNCTKAFQKCEFPSPIRTVHRPSKNGTNLKEARAAHGAPDSDAMWEKLERLEGLVRRVTKDAPLLDKDRDSIEDTSKERYSWNSEPYAVSAPEIDSSLNEDGRARKSRKLQHSSTVDITEADLINQALGLSAARLDFSVSRALSGLGEDIQGDSPFQTDIPCTLTPPERVQQSYSSNEQEFTLGNAVGRNMIRPNAIPAGNPSFVNMPARSPGSEQCSGAPNPLKPDLEQRKMIWAAFVNDVDPCVKVVHKPAIERLLLVPEYSGEAYKSTTKPLIFAIYLSSILSMSHDRLTKVAQTFSLDGNKLILIYQGALEQALIEANYLESPTLTILQSIVLYIYYLKPRDTFKCYTLYSAAFRLAIKLSLHRDGSQYNLPVLETEIRRRLWWHLLLFEDRSAEDYGSLGHWSLSLSPEPDTKFPANIDDLQLESMPSKSPSSSPSTKDGSRPRITENTFGLVQFEISQAFRRIKRQRLLATGRNGPQLSLKSAEAILIRSQELIDAKFFQNHHSHGPFEIYIQIAVKIILMKRKFMLYQHAANNVTGVAHVPESARNCLFNICIEILAKSRMLRKDPMVLRWRWQNAGYFQWHVSEVLLEELKVRPISSATGHAWSLLDGLLAEWPDAIQISSKGVELHTKMAITAQVLEGKRTHMLWYFSPRHFDSQPAREHKNDEPVSFDNGKDLEMTNPIDCYGFDTSFDLLLNECEAPLFP